MLLCGLEPVTSGCAACSMCTQHRRETVVPCSHKRGGQRGGLRCWGENVGELCAVCLQEAQLTGTRDRFRAPLRGQFRIHAAAVPFGGVPNEYRIGGLNPSPRRHWSPPRVPGARPWRWRGPSPAAGRRAPVHGQPPGVSAGVPAARVLSRARGLCQVPSAGKGKSTRSVPATAMPARSGRRRDRGCGLELR